MAQHNRFGNEAEEKALDYLLQKGYTLLEKNYRYGHAEVDLLILMQKKEKLICVEVKARSIDFFGTPHELDLEVRFDVIALTRKKDKWFINHIKNAFYAWE